MLVLEEWFGEEGDGVVECVVGWCGLPEVCDVECVEEEAEDEEVFECGEECAGGAVECAQWCVVYGVCEECGCGGEGEWYGYPDEEEGDGVGYGGGLCCEEWCELWGEEYGGGEAYEEACGGGYLAEEACGPSFDGGEGEDEDGGGVEGGHGLELGLDFDGFVGFDDVALLDVVVVGEADAAFEVGVDFFCVVFEALECVDVSGVDDDAVADEACVVGAADGAVGDVGACYVAYFADVVYLSYFECGGDLFFYFGCEHAFHGGFDVVDGVVDDGVEAYVDALLFCCFACGCGGSYLESYDDGL